MIKSISKTKKKGFTIVELLVVIVVIGILAAITIVSYTGITNKAKTSKAQASASSTLDVANLYNAENGLYPVLASVTLGTYAKLGSGNTVLAATSSTIGETTVGYTTCGTSHLGAKATYYDFSAATIVTLIAGSC